MRQIGSLDTEKTANRFADYLTTIGISTHVEASKENVWSVWVREEDQLAVSRKELDRFLENPEADEFVQAVSDAQRLRLEEAKRRKRAASKNIDVRERWSAPFAKRAPLTAILIGLCIVIGLLSGSVLAPNQPQKFRANPVFRTLSLYDPIHSIDPKWDGDAFVDIKRGQVWRLFTPAFLHRGFAHIVFNMFILHFFGGRIETIQRWPRILLLFLIGSAGGVLAEYFLSDATAVGFSGVGYCMFGYLWIYGLLEPGAGIGMEPQNVAIFLGWLVAGFAGILHAVFGMEVANWAHLGGLVAGVLAAVAAVWYDQFRRQKKEIAAA